MDGNFRWGRQRGGDWRRGHQEGVQALRRVMSYCREDGVKALTVYAFSTENWGRSGEEVAFLLRLIEATLERQLPELAAQGVRLAFAGERAGLPASLRRAIERAEEATAANSSLLLCVCLSYGGRQDITRAAQELCRQVVEGSLRPEQVTEELLAAQLSTRAVRSAAGDPDLLIRTSGEQRLSNFLLWESAYTELHFTPACWPDFDRHEWDAALEHYAARQRRYGRRGGAAGGGTAAGTAGAGRLAQGRRALAAGEPA
ncbi:hypothetical protein GPECTOR_576g625 [Gonium pectorale]|uniref:Alkyl transferase n=1 Tax=Gonium pectorale TaxID=33097 RepID=A0A150FUJ7_GONPE|nr:hypothetical protein GPECTOR_576g625 [Gonium pectorale]|eukprot:KXZ41287.1 hypothetical protein GPECTOR_576g625 [Gonium pectorale]